MLEDAALEIERYCRLMEDAWTAAENFTPPCGESVRTVEAGI